MPLPPICPKRVPRLFIATSLSNKNCSSNEEKMFGLMIVQTSGFLLLQICVPQLVELNFNPLSFTLMGTSNRNTLEQVSCSRGNERTACVLLACIQLPCKPFQKHVSERENATPQPNSLNISDRCHRFPSTSQRNSNSSNKENTGCADERPERCQVFLFITTTPKTQVVRLSVCTYEKHRRMYGCGTTQTHAGLHTCWSDPQVAHTNRYM